MATVAKGELSTHSLYTSVSCLHLFEAVFFSKIFPQQTYMYGNYRSIIFYKYFHFKVSILEQFCSRSLSVRKCSYKGAIANRDSL